MDLADFFGILLVVYLYLILAIAFLNIYYSLTYYHCYRPSYYYFSGSDVCSIPADCPPFLLLFSCTVASSPQG